MALSLLFSFLDLEVVWDLRFEFWNFRRWRLLNIWCPAASKIAKTGR